jgi:hypothetical protein
LEYSLRLASVVWYLLVQANRSLQPSCCRGLLSFKEWLLSSLLSRDFLVQWCSITIKPSEGQLCVRLATTLNC